MKITAAMIAFAMTASQLCADDPPFVKELEQLQKLKAKYPEEGTDVQP